MTADAPLRSRPSPLDRALRLFGDVRAGEGVTAVLLLVNLFLLLVAYYIVKTVREPLILSTGGAELKSYAAGAQAVVLMGAVPLYGYIASRVRTDRLVWGVTVFFLVCIQLFFVGAKLSIPDLGFIFYVWVGIFSVAIIAQFWSFANDIYVVDKGERLFPLVALGATTGAPVGAWVAKRLFALDLGPFDLLQVAAAILVVQVLLYAVIMRRPDGKVSVAKDAADPAEKVGGFRLVFRSSYLRLIALLLILLNLVNSTGEFLLSSYAEAQLEPVLAAALSADPGLDKKAFINSFFGQFYADFFFWVNIAGVVLQALFVSRIVKYLGIAGVLFALPVVAFGTYAWVAVGASLTAFRWFKTTENATDYSIMNTAKAMLWLPTSRQEKYKAKQAVDTFFVRLGDVFAAGLVFAGTNWLAFGTVDFARVNVLIIVVWAVVAFLLLRQYKALKAADASQ